MCLHVRAAQVGGWYPKNIALVICTMTNPEKLCFQWDDFKQNIGAAFGDLRGDKEFTDVTLVCEDGQQVEAHKVVLASSSLFFKDLLRKNRHPHPLLYMRALKSEDLIAIVDFLYFGEANIFRENLDSFLAIAEELKVNGLTIGPDEIDKKDEEFKTSPKDEEVHSKREDSPKIKNETFSPRSQPYVNSDSNATVNASIEDLDRQIRSMITKSDIQTGTGKGYIATCNICGKEAPFMTMKRHVESKHIAGISHSCNICGTITRTRDALSKHKAKSCKRLYPKIE